MAKSIAIKLKPAAERYVKQGHPWVYDASIIKQSREGQTGDTCVVFDAKKNRFLVVGLYDADSPIRIKILSTQNGVKINMDWIVQSITTAWARRQTLLSDQTNSCRIIYGEGDGMPGLICDKYADVLVIKLYSLIWEQYLDDIVKAIQTITDCKTIILRLSRNVKAKSKYKEGQSLYGECESSVVQFLENGVTFETDVIRGHKTGFFLDHRPNRYAIQQISKEKRVLDVFAYSGGFSTHALVGGATSVVSVDISSHALALAVRHAELNAHTGKHQTLCGDAFELLEDLVDKGDLFDIVIIDPPSFAKKASELPKAIKAYQRIFALGAKLVAKDGLLLLASCTSRITPIQFKEICQDVLDHAKASFWLERETGHDIDHPATIKELTYLKSLYWRRKI